MLRKWLLYQNNLWEPSDETDIKFIYHVNILLDSIKAYHNNLRPWEIGFFINERCVASYNTHSKEFNINHDIYHIFYIHDGNVRERIEVLNLIQRIFSIKYNIIVSYSQIDPNNNHNNQYFLYSNQKRFISKSNEDNSRNP